MDNSIVASVTAFLVSTRYELFLFIAAAAAHFLLFSNAAPKRTKPKQPKVVVKSREDERGDPLLSDAQFPPELATPSQIETAFAAAFEIGDHRQVLCCWNAAKKCDQVPSLCLAKVVESMQRFKKDTPFILKELSGFIQRNPAEYDIGPLNDLLDSLGKRLDSEFMEQLLNMFPAIGLAPNPRTYEILLNTHFTMRSFADVKRIVQEMRQRKVPLTTRASLVVIKACLKTSDLEEAIRHFRDLKPVLSGSGSSSTPSLAPRHIVTQLIELACKERQLAVFLPELGGVAVPEEAAAAMLQEAARLKDPELVRKVEQLARAQDVKFTDTTYCQLIRGLAGDTKRVPELFDEVVEKQVEITSDLALAFLTFCNQTGSVTLADKLYARMRPRQLPVLSAFIRFYADVEQFEKACDIYERELKELQVAGNEGQKRVLVDARMERSLMNAALRCGRSHLAKTFLESSPSDVAKHITMIRNCAGENDLKGVMGVFESLQQSGAELSSIVYNTVLDAWVECRDLVQAEAWMERMKVAGVADVVSYNTLIKAHLGHDNFDKARSLMEEMRVAGLQPNRVTYNELVNAMVAKSGAARRGQIWEVLDEMLAAGVKPNQVTCSILLKNLNGNSHQADIMKTMDLISSMEEPMDEVLLSSVVEACVRIGQPDLLSTKLRQLQDGFGIPVTGSHTFGSLIKAYGYARDMDGVWRCWKEMRSRHVRPTSITLGCMVEAVVSNGDTEGAYELIHQMQEDEQCRDALNAVIYCSVLKGFTREKRLERVWDVYREMQQQTVELSVVTYNTLLDAAARCGRMDQVPEILDDMRRAGIRANLITYSTMLKGHCQAGNIQLAFSILDEMKRDTTLKPDEIMYNSLLDGCAQNNLVDEGLRLLKQMEDEGVHPSNFTLSILVKMMSRGRKLDGAFAIVEEVTQRYKIRANVHVYANLVQACVSNRQFQRALTTLEQMIQERVQPDNRTYAILLRSCLQQGFTDLAVSLLRGALAMEGSLPLQARFPAIAACPGLESGLVNEVVRGLVSAGAAPEAVAALAGEIRAQRPRVRLEGATQQLLSGVNSGEPLPQASGRPAFASSRQGKGYGKGRPYAR